MAEFAYKGRDQSGQLHSGVIEAESLAAAADMLRQRNLLPVSINPRVANTSLDLSRYLHRVRLAELIIFCRQMHALLKAGVPILRATRGLAESTQSLPLRRALTDISEHLEQGNALSTAMNQHGNVFSPLFVAMVHVGENTGRLDAVFLQLAHYHEREEETRKQIQAATRYPTFVLIAISIAMVILNIFVIPKFAEMFSSFGAELPWATQILLATSTFFVNYWWLLAALLVGGYGLFLYWLTTSSGRWLWDRQKLRFPIFGAIIHRASLARYARSLSLTLEAGVPLTSALSLVANAVDNAFMASRIVEMRQKIERGESLLRVSHQSGLFTPLVMQMIAVGEETGRVSELMTEVAEFYEREVDYDIKTLSARFEPILIAAVAAMVLVLALGIFTPMWDVLAAYQGGN